MKSSAKDLWAAYAHNSEFEQILTNPILDIAARVWDEDRYQAFRVCYRSMRVIDDLVDDRKQTGHELTGAELQSFTSALDDAVRALVDGTQHPAVPAELVAVMERFRMPTWPWVRLARSMTYDLKHDGFASILTFRRYAEGAAIAPASVFMHLCGVQPRSDGGYDPPVFDIRRFALDLALFSYYTHLMRDFEKDQLSNLNYFADNLMARFGVTRDMLKAVARTGNPDTGSRALMREYKRIAEFYRLRARRTVDIVSAWLEAPYRLSLEIIYDLYLHIFQRVNPDQGDFSAKQHVPTAEEVKVLLQQVLESFQAAQA